jgi:hypothetical protein
MGYTRFGIEGELGQMVRLISLVEYIDQGPDSKMHASLTEGGGSVSITRFGRNPGVFP